MLREPLGHGITGGLIILARRDPGLVPLRLAHGDVGQARCVYVGLLDGLEEGLAGGADWLWERLLAVDSDEVAEALDELQIHDVALADLGQVVVGHEGYDGDVGLLA